MGMSRSFATPVLRTALLCTLLTAAPAARPGLPAPADVVAVNIDTTVSPGADFFSFANGAWLKTHPIPPAESSWGIGKLVDEDLYAKLRTISEQAAANKKAAADSDERKVGDFWETAMDEELADRLGITPLQADLAHIDAIKDRNGILNVAFELQRQNLQPFFSFGIAQDEKASDVMAVYIMQGGLGLPDRDYYLGHEAGTVKAREAYVVHMSNVLKLLGADAASAQHRAQAMMAFETALATVSRPLADLRDPQQNYNKMTPRELTRKYTPSVAWATRMKGWNLTPRYVIVGQPEFLVGLETQLTQTALPTLRDYLRIRLIDAYAPYLSTAFDAEHFNFYGRVLSGQLEQRPRWKRTLDEENDALGMILGAHIRQGILPGRHQETLYRPGRGYPLGLR